MEREGEMSLPQKMVGDWCWWRASHHSCPGPQGVELAPQRTRDGREREREMLVPQKIVRDWCWRRAEHHITAGQVPRELNWLGWEGKDCFNRRWLETFNWVEFHAVQQSIIKDFKISPLMANGYKPVRYKVWE